MLPEREWFDVVIGFTDGNEIKQVVKDTTFNKYLSNIYSVAKIEAELYNKLFLEGQPNPPVEVEFISAVSKSQRITAYFGFRNKNLMEESTNA